MLKHPLLRDRKYLDHLRTQPCILTGMQPSEFSAVDPMHIGTAGKSLKSPDNEALPVSHTLHALAHQSGEISMLRAAAPDDVLRAAFRALARERYAKWKATRP